ncbi:MAG: LysE family translocator [Gammaproteobacteria bacterium]|nr:LysE family translocator [Gammaproteobacteria bacterium]
MPSFLPAFVMFALVAGFTPGPNNLMVASSGVNFGYRRTLPHLAGIIIGFPVLMLGVGFGLGEVFQRYPLLHEVLKVAGSAYLVFLAWKIAFAGAVQDSTTRATPLTFWQAAAFQLVNPKAWMMIISAITTYTTPGANYWWQLLVMVGVALLVTLASSNTWCLFGVGLRDLLATRPRLLRAFNALMGILLVGSLIPVWL